MSDKPQGSKPGDGKPKPPVQPAPSDPKRTARPRREQKDLRDFKKK